MSFLLTALHTWPKASVYQTVFSHIITDGGTVLIFTLALVVAVSPDILRTQDYSDANIPNAQIKFNACSVPIPYGFMFGTVLDSILKR